MLLWCFFPLVCHAAQFPRHTLQGMHFEHPGPFTKATSKTPSVATSSQKSIKSPSGTAGKISYRLRQYIDQEKSRRVLYRGGVADDEKMVKVILETDLHAPIENREFISRQAEVLFKKPGYMGIKLPVHRLEEVVNAVGAIRFARMPYRFFPTGLTSEGVSHSGAIPIHDRGFTGSGVRVAVIDIGFKGATAAQQVGELPTHVVRKDFSGKGLETEYKHGTGCAEIIHDMAPDAELYLIKISDEADFQMVGDYCRTHGIDIISFSLGSYGEGPGDGTGALSDECNRLRNDGVLFVASAGNSAVSTLPDGLQTGEHWQGGFVDSGSNHIEYNTYFDLHHFSQGGISETYNGIIAVPRLNDDGEPETDELTIVLSWNDWNGAGVDYDMFLYDYYSGYKVAESIFGQTGSERPVEFISFDIPDNVQFRVFALKVVKPQGEPAGVEFEISLGGASYFIPYNKFPSPVATSSSSIAQPADTESVIAVGAIDHANWTTGPQEEFSSQGPTNAWNNSPARVKPDISGPDGVSNMSYAPDRFYGTSAAAPHVAGAAALYLSMHPQFGPDEIEEVLLSTAVDMGTPGKDNLFGWGRVNVEMYNHPPVLGWVGSKTVNENIPLQFSLNAGDEDNDTPVFSSSDLPQGARLDSTTGIFSWQPTFLQAGSYSVRFTVTDGIETDFQDVTITVSNVNRQPVLAEIGNITIREGELLLQVLTAQDDDRDVLLTYSGTNLPSGMLLNSSTGEISWRPTFTQAGVYPSIRFRVTDGVDTDFEDITITVDNVIHDINDSGVIDLADCILALQIASGVTLVEDVFIEADVNGDGKIGMQEAVHAMQAAAGLRDQ